MGYVITFVIDGFEKADLNDLNHTFLVSCLTPMFSAKMQLKPRLLKKVVNHDWNPAKPTLSPRIELQSREKKVYPRLPENLNRVKTRWKSPVFPGYPVIQCKC